MEKLGGGKKERAVKRVKGRERWKGERKSKREEIEKRERDKNGIKKIKHENTHFNHLIIFIFQILS